MTMSSGPTPVVSMSKVETGMAKLQVCVQLVLLGLLYVGHACVYILGLPLVSYNIFLLNQYSSLDIL